MQNLYLPLKFVVNLKYSGEKKVFKIKQMRASIVIKKLLSALFTKIKWTTLKFANNYSLHLNSFLMDRVGERDNNIRIMQLGTETGCFLTQFCLRSQRSRTKQLYHIPQGYTEVVADEWGRLFPWSELFMCCYSWGRGEGVSLSP